MTYSALHIDWLCDVSVKFKLVERTTIYGDVIVAHFFNITIVVVVVVVVVVIIIAASSISRLLNTILVRVE